MYRIIGDQRSGNNYKVKLLLSQLGAPHEWIPIDIRKGAARTPEFRAKNPYGKTPLLQIEDGTYLPESNAILGYVADGSSYLPAERLQRAQVMQWLCWELVVHQPAVSAPRYIVKVLGDPADQQQAKQEMITAGHAAFGVMEEHLKSRRFFVAERYTIADTALYAYTHVAHEGGYEMARYPAINAWLERVSAVPGYVPIGSTPAG